MGMPAAEKKLWTVADVRRLRDAQDAQPFGPHLTYEVVDGELLVTPAPTWTHQQAVYLLQRRLDDFAGPRRLGVVLASPADVDLEERTGVQPDVFVAPLVDGRRPSRFEDVGRLLLVAEVLSPTTARYDRGKKRLRYQRAGIPEYWIVDLDARVVERWRPDDERPEVLSERLAWHPAGAAEPLVIDLQRYFAETWGEDPPSDG
jgi:Uma2 family endonuclease